MIFKNGDIFKNLGENSVLVHGCNAQGVWGSGMAEQAKKHFPLAYEQYRFDLRRQGVGTNSFWHSTTPPDIIVCSMITQQYYGRDGSRYVSYDALDECFDHLFSFIRNENQRRDVHIPNLIGAGLGGGDKHIITQIIASASETHGFDENQIVIWNKV